MAKINVSLDGYYDAAVNAGAISQLSEQIKTHFLTIKNDDSIQMAVQACDLYADLTQAEKNLDDIIYRSNQMCEAISYAYYTYSEVEKYEKNTVNEAISLNVKDITLTTDPNADTNDGGADGFKIAGTVIETTGKVLKRAGKLFARLSETALNGLKFTEKGAYTIVSGAIRDVGCGTRYLTETLENGSSAVSDIFNKTNTFSTISDTVSIVGDGLSIIGNGISAGTKIYDIWNDDDLTEKEKTINTVGVSIATTIGVALNVASILCTCGVITAPIGAILKAAEKIVTSDSGIESITSTVNSVVEAAEQIGSSVSSAYETGKVDMEAIGNNLVNSVGDAIQTGGEIITNAWDQLMDSDGVLDAIGNGVNLVCAPVAAATAVVTNTVVAATTAVVNTVASAGAAVVNWFKKW